MIPIAYNRKKLLLLCILQSRCFAWPQQSMHLLLFIRSVSRHQRALGGGGFMLLAQSPKHQWTGNDQRCYHIVHGIECVEVNIPLLQIGSVTTLEATAKSQDILVNMAIDDDMVNLPSGDPYGTVLWPAASAVANRLLSPSSTNEGLSGDCLVKGKSILELGAGTGLVSIAAALGGASSVLATDYEEIPLQLLRYAASHLNGAWLSHSGTIQTAHFDLCDPNQILPKADILVVSDLMYEPATGVALARRVYEAIIAGCHVFIGDSPGRAGRPSFLSELSRLGVQAEFKDIVGRTVTGTRHELICGPESPSVTPIPQALVVSILELDHSNILSGKRQRTET